MIEIDVQSLGFAEVTPDGRIAQFTRQIAYRCPAMLMFPYRLLAIHGDDYDYLRHRAPQHFGADHRIANAEKLICKSDEFPGGSDPFLGGHSI